MQYGLAFNYVTSRSGGWSNLLLITVCTLIPVVGPIVLLGYQAEVAIALLEDEDRRRHPKFDFDRFIEYLTRGLWPFLMGLVGAAVMVPLFIVAMFGSFFAAAAVGPPDGIIFIFVGYFLGFAVMMAGSMFFAPMQFQAKLAGKFDLGGAWRFTKSFWLTVGGTAILSWLIFVPLSAVVVLIGLLACFIGVYPASALVQMASLHVMVQLYDEYLDRGGEPIKILEPEEKPARRRRRRRREEEYDDEDD